MQSSPEVFGPWLDGYINCHHREENHSIRVLIDKLTIRKDKQYPNDHLALHVTVLYEYYYQCAHIVAKRDQKWDELAKEKRLASVTGLMSDGLVGRHDGKHPIPINCSLSLVMRMRYLLLKVFSGGGRE